ncbi:MAG: hypothetical protein ACREX9_10235, partial [Gammaproteobacteria bacterium]
RPSRLRYRYTKTGTAEEQHTDVIDLEVLRVHPDGQKGVQVHYFTGKHEKRVPDQDPVTGNPVLAVYLQADVYAMNRRTEGGWRYFHRAIKTALAATNTVEPVSLDFHGRKVPASRVTITPYLGDAKRLPLKAYAQTTYAFTFAEAVPDQLYEPIGRAPARWGAPHRGGPDLRRVQGSVKVSSPPWPRETIPAIATSGRAAADAASRPPSLTNQRLSGSAPCGVWRDWAEVSRRRSSRTPTVVGGTGGRPEPSTKTSRAYLSMSVAGDHWKSVLTVGCRNQL